MDFLSQFSQRFTPQERQTELYQLWSSIGVNMEKAIVEEQTKINTEMSDINNFSENTMRSWLAFFLQKIPYRTTATCPITVSLDGDYERTEIPQYSQLQTSDGIIYTQMEPITLTGHDVRTVTCAQGTRIVETGTYGSIIKVQATNPDLSYLTVKLDNEVVPEVSYETSYDQLSFMGKWKPQNEEGREFGGTPFLQDAYGSKGRFYTVIQDGLCKFKEDGISKEFITGDIIIYDGYEWQRSASNNNLKPIQFSNTYAVPSNGYYAYYYDGYLYIKIFSGTEVGNPSGKQYEISYISSDGIQGEINANTLSYISSFTDINETTVKLEVSNEKSSSGVNEPNVGKLGLYLKQRLYGSVNVSSVPEYTSWFLAQPEVGDCLVLSDYEKYLRSGKFEVTGIVDIYLVDGNGKPLTDSVKSELLDRIEPYKDIAVLKINEFVEVKNFLKFEYTSTTSPDQFEQYVKAKASQYYNLSYLQSTNSSLFENLDLSAVMKDIQDNNPYESSGLILRGYHFKDFNLSSSYLQITENSYAGEFNGNGWYELEFYDSDGNIIPIYTDESGKKYTQVKLVENRGSTGVCNIYDNQQIPDTPVGPSEIVGTHTDDIVSLNLTAYYNKLHYASGKLRCYWSMANEGILTVGAENGLRSLEGISITQVQ